MSDQRDFYGISQRFDRDHPNGEWLISHHPKGYGLTDDPVVWRRDCSKGEFHGEDGQPPADVRTAYERIIGYDPSANGKPPQNAVEMITDGDEDNAFDQPCRFGHRVDGHAVYCHNTAWLYAPRKCRRRQTDSRIGEAWPHEGCAGFEPNPAVPRSNSQKPPLGT